jgi:hypothetical protein
MVSLLSLYLHPPQLSLLHQLLRQSLHPLFLAPRCTSEQHPLQSLAIAFLWGGKVGIGVAVAVFVVAAVMWLIRRKFRERRSKGVAPDTPSTRLEWKSELDTLQPTNEMLMSNGVVEMEG